MDIKVSLFASAVRIPFYKTFLDSLLNTTVPIEVVFCGPNTSDQIIEWADGNPNAIYIGEEDEFFTGGKLSIVNYDQFKFKYLHSKNIKPAQCYEAARRASRGETIQWSCDDSEYSEDLLGKAYRFWKGHDDEKLILSIQTLENGMFCDMRVHSFFGCQFHTPLMAPLALMSAKLMDDLGGFDRRYICGQYENDAVMRVIEAGGSVKIFGDRKDLIVIDHYRRHGIKRPFATGYNHDREVLEKSWTDGSGRPDAKVFLNIQRPFEPYVNEGILEKSQAFKNSNWV